jgi:HK97 family phage portal protein
VLHNGLKWTKLTIDPVDAEMLESRRLSMEIVCQIFEVDPHLVGITTGNTTLGSSISDQTLSLVKFKMHKRLKRIEGALEKQLLTRLDRQQGVKIRFNLEGFLRADSLGRAQYYNLMKQFMTVNEVRALEGLPPVPGGNVIYRQMQDEPLSGRGIGDNGGPPLEKNT